MRLDLLDAQFPRNQHIYQVGQLPLQELPPLEQQDKQRNVVPRSRVAKETQQRLLCFFSRYVTNGTILENKKKYWNLRSSGMLRS